MSGSGCYRWQEILIGFRRERSIRIMIPPTGLSRARGIYGNLKQSRYQKTKKIHSLDIHSYSAGVDKHDLHETDSPPPLLNL